MNIQQAREKIKRAKAENSTWLDLSSFENDEKLTSNDLVKLLPEIKELTSLTELDLSDNQISDIKVLGQLTSLTELFLYTNQISEIEALGELTSLRSLFLFKNQIREIEVLGRLISLTALYLGKNQIKDIEVLGQLTSLTELGLGKNQISDIEVLGQLTSLTELDLYSNQINEIEALGELMALTELTLFNNQISDIKVLGQLTSLTELNLCKNQIKDIEVLGQLTSLTELDLSDNQISNIESLGQLTSLTELDLSYNQISDIEVLGQLKHLKDLFLSRNPIKNPPLAIANQGIEAIRKYFEDNTRQKYEPVYETKVLIVGETETGKTTLFNKLLNPKYLPSTATKSKKKSTVGINIKTWEFPYTNDSEETIKANLWDFGGQEIQYTLHQYFLTKSSFYIFLISNRVGDNEKIHKADYWFKVISALGKDCPVLVILNERHDKSANTFDINKYIKQFGANLGTIEKIDVDFDKNDHRWDYLLETLKRKISNLPHIGEKTEEEKKRNYKKGLPEKWIKIREELEKLAAKNNYIKRSVYDEICKRIGVFENPEGKKKEEILSQDLLLRFLHNLGVIINFEDALLRNYLILNPNWLTKSLYLALENKTVKDKLGGKITSRFIEELWKSKGYSDEDYLILLNLMLKDNFEIAYKVEGKEDDYVIPMLLPDIPLKYEFDTENVITLIVRFVFMPYGVFSRLVVQLNNYINVQNVNGHEKQIVWKKGMLLDSKRGCFAEVIESDDREQTPKEIKIRAAGKRVDENKRFLEQIVSRIYQINDDWFNNNLEFDELIPCNCEVCKELEDDAEKEMYSFKTIRKFLRNNIYETHCRKSAETVNLGELFDGVYNTPPNNTGDNYYFLDETQFIKEARDKVSIRQRIGAKYGKRGEI